MKTCSWRIYLFSKLHIVRRCDHISSTQMLFHTYVSSRCTQKKKKKNTLHQNKPFSWKKTWSCDIWSQNTKFDIRIIWYFLAWPNVSYYCSRMLSPFNRTHWIAILSKLNVVLWERVLEQVKKKSYLTETLVRGFDKTWGDRQVLCRRHDLHITWNWKRQRS